VAHLADGFETHIDSMSPPPPCRNFHNHHVHILRHAFHGRLDFVGDVGNHLHGLAEIIAAPLAGDDLLVDAPGVTLLL